MAANPRNHWVAKAILLTGGLLVVMATRCPGQQRASRAALRTRLVTRPVTEQALEDRTDAALAPDGDLAGHVAFLDEVLIDVLQHPMRYGSSDRIRVIEDPVMSWALAQEAFLRHVTPRRFASLAASDKDRPFALWLLRSTYVMEDFLESVQPEDDLDEVLRVWAKLWHDDPEGREQYANLAMACALVFDRPLRSKRINLEPSGSGSETTIDVDDRYAFFRAAADRGSLKSRLEDLAPWELVWVVDARVPDSELAWANSHVHLSRANWSRAYGMVRYRMDKARGDEKLYATYTLKEILKRGGTCGDQAHFASVSAKANGIPAVAFAGTGQRGAHAWFGYKSSSQEWNMNTGRYAGDAYATGHTRDHQTGKRRKQQTIELYTDPQRRSADFRRASRLTWLADVCISAKEVDEAGALLWQATGLCSRHVPAWEAYGQHLRTTSASPEAWEEAIRKLRSAFRRFPDWLELADELEIEVALARDDFLGAADLVHRQLERLEGRYEDRKDLVLPKVGEQVELLKRADAHDLIPGVYRDALEAYGDDPQVFRKLATDYAAYAGEGDDLHRAIRHINSEFKQHYNRPRKDYFAMRQHASLMRFMADLYERDGQAGKAKRMRQDATSLQEQGHSRAH